MGGSLVRDVSLNLPIAVMQAGSLYAVAAGIGSALTVVLVAVSVPVVTAAVAGVLVTTAVRLGAVRFDWNDPEQGALSLRRRASRS